MRKISKSLLATMVAMYCTYGVAYAEEEKLDSYDIGEMVVTAAGYEQDIKDAPATITVVSKEEIAKTGLTDLRDVLSKVEGVDVYGSAGRMGVANISIRGMGHKYTLLMIDGVPTNGSADDNLGPNGFSMELSSLLPPVANIERIEVIKGPMSTLYGSDAMGGVINIITKKTTNETHGSITLNHTFETEKGRGDTTNVGFNVSTPIVNDKLSVQVSGNQTLRLNSVNEDGKSIDGANVTPPGAKNWSLGTKFVWNPNGNNKYTLNLNKSVVDFTDHGDQNLGVKFGRERYTIAAQNTTKNGTFNTDLTYQHTKLYDWAHWTGKQDQYKTMEATNLIFNEKYVTQLDNHKLTIGTKLWKESVDLDTLRVQGVKGDLSVFNKAFFAEDTWKMGKKISFTYGLRYDMPENFDNHLSPRGYAVYKADDNWTIKGGIAAGYKAPSLVSTQSGMVSYSDSRQGRGGGRRVYTYGNPNLQPETSISKEIGAYYSKPEVLDAHLTYFNIDYRDKIGTVEIDSTHNRYTNTTKAHSHGIELGSKFVLHPKWDLAANYTFTMSEILGGIYDGQPVDHTPRHMVNTTLTYYPDAKSSIWLGMEYRAKMARYTGAKVDQDIVNKMGRYYKPYTIFNLGAQYKFNNSWQVNFTVNNLLDKDFNETEVVNGTEYNYYCTPGKGGTGSYIGRRSFWIGLTYNF